jgi:hypothetical protein
VLGFLGGEILLQMNALTANYSPRSIWGGALLVFLFGNRGEGAIGGKTWH